jgi:hypothetical protein
MMGSTTSKKLDTFISKPLQDTNLLDVPGIGPVAAGKLKDANIDTSEKLVGYFLVLGRDTERFGAWLHEICGVRSQDAVRVSQALETKAMKILLL